MEKKQYLVYDTGKSKFAIATLVKEERSYRVDFSDGTEPITNQGDGMLFLVELKDKFQNPQEALMANLPEVIAAILKWVSSINRSVHPRYI